MAKLRNILNLHNIDFPSSAKKSELIQIFERELAPKAPVLLAEYTSRIGNSHDQGFMNATDNDDETSEKEGKLTPREDKKRRKGTTEPAPEKSKISTENAKVAKPRVKKEPKSKDDKNTKDTKAKHVKRSDKPEQMEHKSRKLNADEGEHETPKTEQGSEVDNSESDATENLSSFSDQNVFQLGKELSRPPRKRKLKTSDEQNVSAKKLKSPPASNRARVTKSPSKSIFDDSDSEIFDNAIVDKKRYNTPSEEENTIGAQSPKTPSAKTIKSLPHSTNEKSFRSLQEEMENFDKQLEVVKQKHITETPVKTEKEQKPKSRTTLSPTVDKDLAKLLGITIQGFQPPVVPSLMQNLSQGVDLGLTAPLNQSGESSTNVQSERLNDSEHSWTNSSILSRRNVTPQRSALLEEQALGEQKTPKSTSSRKKKKKETPSKDATPILKVTPKSSQLSKKSKTPLSGKNTPKRLRTPLGRVALTPKPRLLSINSTRNALDSDEEEEVKEGNLATESQQVILDGPNDSIESILLVNTALTFLTWIIVMLSALFGYWYYEQKYLVGYCGQEIDQPTFEDSSVALIGKLGNALDKYCKPNCILCPQHARCFTNLELGCFEDFMEFKPWYDFVVPGHKKCIPDTKKAEKLEIMIDVALDLLRSRNAVVDCGKSSDDIQSGISVRELHDLLLSMKAPYITTEEFEELWSRSVVELKKEPDIILRQVRTF